MRSRIVIPAAILVTAAYVKGRLDAHLPAEPAEPRPIPVATPGDPLDRARAEAADAIALAEAQVAAAGTPVAERPVPTFTPHPFRPQVVSPRPAPAPARPAPSFEVPAVEWPSFEPEWLAGPRERAAAPLDPAWSAVLAEWIAVPATPSPHVRDAAEAAALCEWSAHVAAPAPAAAEPQPQHEPAPELEAAPEPEPASEAEVVVEEDGRFSLGGWAAQSGHLAVCGVTFRDRRGAPVEAAAIRLVTEAAANVAEGGLVVLGDAGFAPDAEGFTLMLAAAAPGSFAASGRYEVVAAA